MRGIIFILIVMVLAVQSAVAGSVDNSLYAQVLQRHVDNGLVDYVGLKANRAPLDAYLNMMGSVDPATLSRDEQLAFYINLYNAATLKLIIDHYPVESIKDIGPFFSTPWKQKVVVLDGELVTLDNIEHDIVRPTFKEPRIHFALNCTAMSCPPLLTAPYEAQTLNKQLDTAAIGYINDGNNNYLDGNKLYVSEIFDWFSEDFPEDFIRWFVRYARGELKAGMDAVIVSGRTLKVKYLDYDWSLNEQSD